MSTCLAGYSPAVPWSETVVLAWRPNLAFFERRSDFLRELEKAHTLAAFRWREDSIDIRLGARETLTVTPRGAVFGLVGVSARREVAAAVAGLTLRLLRPEAVILDQVLVQELVPVDIAYAEARRFSAMRLLRDLMPGVVYTDWSVLLDGVSSDFGAPFQVEFGVVNDDEVPSRLARLAGHMHGPDAVPDDVWADENLPACALFADWRWLPRRSVGAEDSEAELVSLWDKLVGEAGRITLSLSEELVGVREDLEGGVL